MQINNMNTAKSAKGDLAALVVNKNNDTKGTGCRPSMVFWFLVSALLMVALWLEFPSLVWRAEAPPEPVLACYYTVPASAADLQPERIDPHLCTHINVAFAAVRDKQIHLEPELRDTLTRVVQLKRVNPRLRVLISVGGAGADGFSEMVADHASRKVFIKSIKAVLRDYSLDGVDLDWEYPNVHETCNRSMPYVTSCLVDAEEVGGRQRQHFSQLLREIRAEYFRERRNYLLTVAVASAEIIINVAYDIAQLNLYTDFVNVMSYDYHFYSSVTPFTGFNSPLYAERGQQLYMATMNINYTVGMYLQRGLLREKLVLGVPTYGHSFRLVNENNGNPGAPASGVGRTGSAGFVDYATACALARGGARRADLPAVPYVQRGQEWLSYDDVRSVERKAVFLCSMGLRGAMIFSLNTDDFRGSCGQGGPRPQFPLVSRLRRSLRDCRAQDY